VLNDANRVAGRLSAMLNGQDICDVPVALNEDLTGPS
jgi:hypothetical protein